MFLVFAAMISCLFWRPDSWHRVIGGIGEGWLPGLLAEADCVVMVGSASFENQFLPNVPLIQLEEEPWQVNDLYLWSSLAGDPALVLKTLTEGLKGYQGDPTWQEKIAAAKKAWQEAILSDANNNSVPIHPGRLMTTLAGATAGDAIISLDVGAFMHWFDRSFQAKEQTILLSAFWRSMGAGLPAAIAAKLKYPKRQAVALVGDGGMLMTLGEFAVAVKHKLPITVIVVRNHLYGLEHGKGVAKGLNPVGLDLAAVEFSQYAAACGGKGFKVENPSDLQAILAQALALDETVLVDIICNAPKLPFV
jgi:pyruvate oxidase